MVKDEDYELDVKSRTVQLTEKGTAKAEATFRIENLFNLAHTQLLHHINQALKANYVMLRDIEYVVDEENDEIVIVDPNTGRLMKGRQWSDGLHQAVEAKEGISIKQETTTLATITYQNFFRLYNKLCGMTGTAKTEEEEFLEIYNMYVFEIPTNRPVARIDYPDAVYGTKKAKFNALVDEVVERHAAGQPVLVGTIAVETSELISKYLKERHIPHEVLNAKNNAREADIIAKAGQKGAVTIATNMAGRGTDIKLGEGVRELGGLCVLGSERHESRRIDNQLRGRSGRQGDPGMSKFFVSLEDDVIKKFGPSWVHKKYKDYQVQDMTQPEILKGRKYRNLVERAQHASDSAGRSARRQTLEYAESMNIQRDMIYKERNRLIDGSRDLEDVVLDIIERYTEAVAAEHYASRELLFHFIVTNISFHVKEIPDNLDLSNQKQVRNFIQQVVNRELSEKKELLEKHDLYEQYLRLSLLKAIDDNWVEQVDYLQQLSMAIGGQSAAQKNPIVEYYQEAYAGFEAMKEQIRADMVRNLLMGLVEVTPKGEILTHFP